MLEFAACVGVGMVLDLSALTEDGTGIGVEGGAGVGCWCGRWCGVGVRRQVLAVGLVMKLSAVVGDGCRLGSGVGFRCSS